MRDIIVLTISRQKLSTVLPIKKNKNVTLKRNPVMWKIIDAH